MCEFSVGKLSPSNVCFRVFPAPFAFAFGHVHGHRARSLGLRLISRLSFPRPQREDAESERRASDSHSADHRAGVRLTIKDIVYEVDVKPEKPKKGSGMYSLGKLRCVRRC